MQNKPIPPNRILSERIASRLTQAELGLLVGVTASTVCQHETHVRPVGRETLLAYAKVFKLATHELFLDPSLFDLA